jgi:3-deoxy-D-manno-octulosonic-acid transferase
MYLIYSLMTVVFFVVALPYFGYKAIRYSKYVINLPERLGLLPLSLNLDREPSIWIHAVSVGEVLAARALAGELKSRYPGHRLFVSTTTITGQQVARRQLPIADGIFYFPIDLTVIVRRVLDVVRPRLFVMMETEIWPNLLRECRRRGIKTMVINGRISARSYPRYRLIRPLFRRVLAMVDRFCVQGEESRFRLVDLGAAPDSVTVTGSLKFDSLDQAAGATTPGRAVDRVLRFFRGIEGRPVLVAGSTFPGEDEILLRSFERIRTMTPNALLVLAPRRPERFGDVESLAKQAGFRTVRRTALTTDHDLRADVVVLDTIGELAQVYQVATAVFVGGSLVDMGGHNILEPAILGKAIVFGPFMQNFAEIAETFLRDGAAIQVATARELEDVLIDLLSNRDHRERLGAAARALVEANRGAKARSLDEIAALLPPPGAPGGNVLPFPSAT